MATVPIGYYVLSPGGAIDLQSRVSVGEGPDHPASGQVDLLTVSERRATPLLALVGWLDPDSSVYPEEDVNPDDVDADELREFNQSQFVGAADNAIGVATERLGYDSVRGTGATVAGLVEDSPAAATLVVGETIVAVGDTAVTVDAEAVAAIGARRPGDEVVLQVEPADGTAARSVAITLAEHPDDATRAFLGVSLQTRDLTIEAPFEVTIDVADIGGPSAGLAMTLAVLDRLTEGELTGGAHVAVTGTIELDGRVGAIGGIEQKASVVEESGATLFLVPRANYEAAKAALGDRVRIEPVDDLDDALAALESAGGDPLPVTQAS